MFERFETTVKLTALLLILGLGGWIWVQSQMITSLKAENQAQAQTIAQQSENITRLKADIAENQQLTIELSKQESETRRQSDEILKSIPRATTQSDAFNSTAPHSIVEFLRK